MAAQAWWRDGVLYQLYPRSFADSDGDGTGDLRGIIGHLDHLAWLGIDGLWLNPTFPSPNADWGFDVADYRDVHPDLGTLADLEDLISAAGERGIRVLLDLVPNHTSDEHPWFVEARGDRDAPHRDWYVWRDPGPGGAPPNNWVSIFGGPAWEPDGASGQSYLHMFHRKQPDLNWWNEDVRAEPSTTILGFWYDRGVAGFRIDVAHGIVKDRDAARQPGVRDAGGGRTSLATARPGARSTRSTSPRSTTSSAAGARSAPAATPSPLLLGETVVRDLEHAHALLRRRRRAAARVQLRVPRRGASTRRRSPPIVARDRGRAARRRVAALDGLQPRRRPLPDALGGRRRAA